MDGRMAGPEVNQLLNPAFCLTSMGQQKNQILLTLYTTGITWDFLSLQFYFLSYKPQYMYTKGFFEKYSYHTFYKGSSIYYVCKYGEGFDLPVYPTEPFSRAQVQSLMSMHQALTFEQVYKLEITFTHHV